MSLGRLVFPLSVVRASNGRMGGCWITGCGVVRRCTVVADLFLPHWVMRKRLVPIASGINGGWSDAVNFGCESRVGMQFTGGARPTSAEPWVRQ